MSKQPIPNAQTGSLDDHQQGTNDTLLAVNNVMVVGDAHEMFNHSIGGDDTLIAGFDNLTFATNPIGDTNGPKGIGTAEDVLSSVEPYVAWGFDRPLDAIPDNPVFGSGTGVKIVRVLFDHDSPLG